MMIRGGERPGEHNELNGDVASDRPAVRGRIGDKQVQAAIGHLLRVGVLIAAAVVFVGAVGYVATSGLQKSRFGSFAGAPTGLNSVTGVLHGALHLQSKAVMQLGLVLLILTPVARVVLSAISFALERDWLYVVITLVVLTLLMVGLVGRGI
jgi:uncharacterized membrane protein